MSRLESTIESLLLSGKGILAADESTGTIEKRLAEIKVTSTEESRRTYRELLFTTPGLGEFVSGVILFDETIRQRTSSGMAMREVLERQGIVPGIKVDKGAKNLAGFPGEKLTLGLDGLRERLVEYRELGARFTKWRAVIAITPELPTRTCMEANARMLAIFGALSQEAGLVPIIEPEVLMNGDHSIERCEEVTTSMLSSVFEALLDHRVSLECMLLKSGMVLSGMECSEQAVPEEVAEATLRCFRRAVPAAVPGIVFLSGGQSDVDATLRLNAICRLGQAPWKLSFSFGRALQAPALKAWSGAPEKISAAQKALHHRARCNGLATQGEYSKEVENG